MSTIKQDQESAEKICWFFLFYIIVYWISFCFGLLDEQNEQYEEDLMLCSGELWCFLILSFSDL